MTENGFVNQGDIFWVTLDPTEGHEQRGRRPVMVISTNDFYRLTNGLVKVLAISSKIKPFPLHVNLPEGMRTNGQVLVQHERTLDFNSSIRNAQFIEHCPKEVLIEIAKLNNMIHEVH